MSHHTQLEGNTCVILPGSVGHDATFLWDHKCLAELAP